MLNAGPRAARRIPRRIRAAVVVGVAGSFLAAVLGPLACTPDSAAVGLGEECFVASDCAPGLVCVPQRGGARLCSNDLTQVVGRPPPEAGGGDTGAEGSADGMADDAADQDTGMPDTSMPDTSMPVDAGADG